MPQPEPVSDYVMVAPPGWPPQVPPPGADHWQHRAVGWLLENITPGWTAYRDFWERYPALLGRHALLELDTCAAHLRRSYSTARVDLQDTTEPLTIEQALDTDAALGRHTIALHRAMQFVADTLNGVRWRPAAAAPRSSASLGRRPGPAGEGRA